MSDEISCFMNESQQFENSILKTNKTLRKTDYREFNWWWFG
jgi:hypothetical protein